jgi:hypothetical protein
VHAELGRRGIPFPRPAEQEVESGLQIRIFDDTSLDRSDLIVTLDPVRIFSATCAK